MRKQRQSFSREFKLEAMRLMEEEGIRGQIFTLDITILRIYEVKP
jgi:transposase-like protein